MFNNTPSCVYEIMRMQPCTQRTWAHLLDDMREVLVAKAPHIHGPLVGGCSRRLHHRGGLQKVYEPHMEQRHEEKFHQAYLFSQKECNCASDDGVDHFHTFQSFFAFLHIFIQIDQAYMYESQLCGSAAQGMLCRDSSQGISEVCHPPTQ